jgi:hypothetical protein
MDGIYFDFALLVALEREADGHVLGGLHQQRSVFLFGGRCPRGKATQQLLQVQSRVGVSLTQFLVQVFFFDVGIMLHLPKPSQQPNRLDHFLLLQGNHAALPRRSYTRACSSPTAATGSSAATHSASDSASAASSGSAPTA